MLHCFSFFVVPLQVIECKPIGSRNRPTGSSCVARRETDRQEGFDVETELPPREESLGKNGEPTEVK